MGVFVLLDPGDEGSYGEEMNVQLFQTKEKLYKHLVEEIENFDVDPEVIESANLYLGKGDYEDILDLYEEVTDVRLQVFERNIIK